MMNGTDMTPEEMADLLKEIDFSDPTIAKKANMLWKMLDRLAEKNPAEYRKFISEQLRQGREFSAFVQPWFSLKTGLREERVEEVKEDDDEKKQRVPRYINFCTSNGVKAPDGETVPIVMSKERRHFDDDEDDVGYFVYDAVFSLDVKTRSETDNMYLDDITKLALDCVEETFKIKLQKRGYKHFLDGTSSTYKGPFTWTKTGKEISQPLRPPRKLENMTPSTLVVEMKEKAAKVESTGADSGDLPVKITDTGACAAARRTPLIQEIGDGSREMDRQASS